MKARFGKLLRLFSPSPSISPLVSEWETPSTIDMQREGARYHPLDAGLMQNCADANMKQPPILVNVPGTPPLSWVQPAYPPTITYSPHSFFGSQPSLEVPPTQHICAVCDSTDRFPIRPSHCPFTGIAIFTSPIQPNHNSSTIISTTHQVRQNLYGQMLLVGDQPQFRAREGDSLIETEGLTEAWEDGSVDADAEYGYYYMSRKSKKRIENWLEWCMTADCRGYEKAGEVVRRARRAQGYNRVDEGLNESWGLRYYDELWDNRTG